MLERLNEEDGHVVQGLAALIAGAGIVALGIGAAGDTDWLTIAGGIIGGVGVLAYAVARHREVDYGLFERVGKLEGK